VDKLARHRQIARLVEGGGIHSQEDLRDRLSERGIEATQGTLSRDLREMGVVKGPGGYEMPERPVGSNGAALRSALQAMLVSAEVAGSMVVLKTEPGNAGALGVQLDRTPPEGCAGTIAGDDTIFIAAYSARQARGLASELLTLAGFRA